MNKLVLRLSKGDHPIEASLKPEKTVKTFQESIDRGCVHIKFIDTQGGTDLGVKLDREASNLDEADFEKKEGIVHLVGELTLDYAKVRCIANVNLETLDGKGHLEPLEA